MNSITKENDLCFYNDQGILTLNAKQFDTGRIFIFNIMDNDEPFDLSDCTASLRIQKADGKQFLGKECCTIDGSKIIVNTSIGNGNQILTANGTNECELHLENSNGITLTTWNFNINVQKRVHNGERISSLDSFDVIDNMVNFEKERIKNEEQRKQNELERIENENQRIAEFEEASDEINTSVTNCNLVIKRAEEKIDNFDKNINAIVDGITDEAKEYADIASTCADKAKLSQEASKISEDNCKDSEEASKISETNAAQSASICASNATTASICAYNVKISEINAKESELNSFENAEKAEMYASTATDKANVASESAASAAASENTAMQKAEEACDYATQSKSYAVGGTGLRENENVDNSGYYYEQIKNISQGLNGLIPMGTITFSELSNEVNQHQGYFFNISDSFVSDERFKDGAGIFYGAGNNVLYTADGMWDVTASSMVSGVKGAAETEYRQGFVNITPANIGAVTPAELDNRVNIRNIFGIINGDVTSANLAQLGISKDLTVLEVYNHLPSDCIAVIKNNDQSSNYCSSFPTNEGAAQLTYKKNGNRGTIQFLPIHGTRIWLGTVADGELSWQELITSNGGIITGGGTQDGRTLILTNDTVKYHLPGGGFAGGFEYEKNGSIVGNIGYMSDGYYFMGEAYNNPNGNLRIGSLNVNNGNIIFANSGTSLRGIQGTMGDNDQWRVMGGATGTNAGYLELATGDDNTEPIYVRQYKGGNFSQLVRTLTLLDANGNTTIPGNLDVNGQVIRSGSNRSWITGRDGALIRTTTQTGAQDYNPLASVKTVSGSWDMGAYTYNNLYFSYITDANYNSGTNTPAAQIIFESSGVVKAKREFIVDNSATSNQFRAVHGNYGAIFRNDGSGTYILITKSGDPYGTWTDARPIQINNATGVCNINGSADKATKDGDGNVIKDTYIKKSDFQAGCNRIASAVTALETNATVGSSPDQIAKAITAIGAEVMIAKKFLSYTLTNSAQGTTICLMDGIIKFLSTDGASGWGKLGVDKVYYLKKGSSLTISTASQSNIAAQYNDKVFPTDSLIADNQGWGVNFTLSNYGITQQINAITSSPNSSRNGGVFSATITARSSSSGNTVVVGSTQAMCTPLIGHFGYRNSSKSVWDVAYFLVIIY